MRKASAADRKDTARESYDSFAEVYDVFQDNVDYEAWCGYICRRLAGQGIEDGLVLDLGCGTGRLTELLAGRGYDMIGVDNSPAMLQEAALRRDTSGHDILYLLQDMESFELYGTVRAVVSVCDSLNYLTEPESLLKTFRLVNNYLDPGGIFLFDVNTSRLYSEILGNATIAENREEGSFIWENEFDEETGLNRCFLTLFIPRGDGLFEKSEELHVQRGYDQEEVSSLLEKAGMELLGVWDGYSDAPPRADSSRLTIMAGEKGKA